VQACAAAVRGAPQRPPAPRCPAHHRGRVAGEDDGEGRARGVLHLSSTQPSTATRR
ncbi:unnamed protein product, partial [Closterium sp. Yama58-4]